MNNCRNASVSAADRILVSSSDEQLFIEVWLVRDDEFQRDLDQYEASVGERIWIDQPATERMREWSVQAIDAGGTRLKVMGQRSGGTGTESLMGWILWPLGEARVNVSVLHGGEVVWSTEALHPEVNESTRPISREALQHLRPMSDGNDAANLGTVSATDLGPLDPTTDRAEDVSQGNVQGDI